MADPKMMEKALKMVTDYARLQDAIAAVRPRISAALDLCPGVEGFRHEEEEVDIGDGTDMLPTDRAAKDVTHLSQWYSPDVDQYERRIYHEPSAEECPHCWAAHQAVQERKRARLALGSVKGSMRKLGRRALASAVRALPVKGTMAQTGDE